MENESFTILGWYLRKRPKLALEHADDYEKKKKIVDNYKKVSPALLKKNPSRI
jgi:hypothetical protein